MTRSKAIILGLSILLVTGLSISGFRAKFIGNKSRLENAIDPSSVSKLFPSLQSDKPRTLGIMVEDLTARAQGQLQLPSHNGVLIVDVIPGSLADIAGLQPGDIINEINHTPAHSARNLMAIIHDLKENGTVLLSLDRKGKTFFAAFDFSR